MRDLSDTEITRLQTLLDERAAAAPADAPLDVSALDGYLCGVLLQPQALAERDWWPFGEPAAGAPAGLAPLVRQRHAVLAEAIAGRRWFDPWIFAPGEEDGDHAEADGEGAGSGGAAGPLSGSLLPWVAGFALAAERFPALLRHDEQALAEPLALLYQHFDAEDLEGLEDEPALAAALAAAEPPGDMTEAAEDLVRAVLLLADVSRPGAPPPSPGPRTGPARASPGPGPRSRSGRPARARRG
ncbi:MAG: UPF0149 family protein [Burkholderiales bacterium]|nr:UPF0149 family protein [Burkholderiales bacterium]